MKRHLHIFLSLIIVIITPVGVAAQGQPTTEGKEFWVSFADNAGEENFDSIYLELKFVATKPAKVVVTYTENNTNETINIPAGVRSYKLNKSQKQASYGMKTGKSSKSIHIVSTESISVFAMNQNIYSADASAILPTSTYGKEYRATGYDSGISHDLYYAIAAEDETVITAEGYPSVSLNRGEVYIYYGDRLFRKQIRGNKRFALFSHNPCTNVPYQQRACDCLFEQLVPTASWGTNFLVPVTVRGVERVRILASKDGTVIDMSPVPPMSDESPLVISTSPWYMSAGSSIEIEIKRHTFIRSNEPIAITSYMVGDRYTALPEDGDPAMVWIPAIEQHISKVTIAPFIATETAINRHFVVIISKTENTGNVKMQLNGGAEIALSGGVWENHPSGYSVYNMSITAVSENAYTFINNNGLVVIAYGYGKHESYSYMAGASVRILTSYFTVNNEHFQDVDYKAYCGVPFNFKAMTGEGLHPDPGRIRWIIDQTEDPSIRDSTAWQKDSFSEGLHTVTMIVKDDYAAIDTLTTHLEVICPPTIVIESRTDCETTLKALSGYPGSLSYQWFIDGVPLINSDERILTTRQAGRYTVKITTQSGASRESSSGVAVHIYKPTATANDITADYNASACYGRDALIQFSSASVLNPVFRWYGDAALNTCTGSGANLNIVGLTHDTTIYVTVSGDNFCENVPTDVKSVILQTSPLPKLNDSADIEVCSNTPFTRTLSSAATATNISWTRNTVAGIMNNAASGAGDINETLVNTGNSTITVNYAVNLVETGGCANTQTIKVSVKPQPEITNPAASQICSGTSFSFTPESSLPSTAFAWTRAETAGISGSSSGVDAINETLVNTGDTPALTTYSCRLEAQGCQTSEYISVLVEPFAPLNITATIAPTCKGKIYEIELSNTLAELFYTVYSESGALINRTRSIGEYTYINADTARTNTVFSVSSEDSNGCKSDGTIPVDATVILLNIITDDLPPYMKGRRYSTRIESDAVDPVYYSTGDNLPEGLSLSASGEITGIVPVNATSADKTHFTVELRDANGCTVYREFSLTSIMSVSQIFSPNGDDINDIFMPGHHLSIYDRFGTLIFKGNDGWNGEYNGKQVVEDTYFYLIRYTDNDGKEQILTGDITVVR